MLLAGLQVPVHEISHTAFAFPKHTEGTASALAALRADTQPLAQIPHAQTGLGTGQAPNIPFPNTLADTDVHESSPDTLNQ